MFSHSQTKPSVGNRQLGDVGRYPPCLIAREQIGRGALSGFGLEIHASQRLAVVVADDKAASVAAGSGASSSQPFAQGAPVLFRRAFHGRCRRVLDFEQAIYAAMAVSGTEAFRDDTFAPKRADVPEDDFPIAVEMLVEGDAVIRAAEEIGQRLFTSLALS